MSDEPQRTDYHALLKRALLKLDEMQARLERAKSAPSDPIAIIGMGCRYPAGVSSPEAFWEVLRNGVDVVTEVPPERWDVDLFYDPDPDAPGKMYTRYGSFLERVDEFDPEFFGIAPREALSMDPQHRLLLEVSWEAIENAGIAPSRLMGSLTGVFIGICGNDYCALQNNGDPTIVDTYFGAGIAHSMAAGRLAYGLGLTGPNFVIDTACSSSLLAAHLACQSLRNGECDMALAGGVSLTLAPDGTMTASKPRMLSPDGRCKTFDASADGYVRGEGCGIVLLKPLEAALAQGDNVLAVIRGSATNQDGRSSGQTAPSSQAQEAVIRSALRNAHIDAARVSYIEAHGTGTSLGDPIELQALKAVLSEAHSVEDPVLIGSVKTNLGHLEGAAGVAGLMKTVLALQHKEIPPHLHFKNPNPRLDWSTLPLRVTTEMTPWCPRGATRIAGVSAFGFSGSNVHMLVEEAPPRPAEPSAAPQRPLHLLTLSAKSEMALRELALRYAKRFAEEPEPPVADVCRTAGLGRSHFDHRLALAAPSLAETRESLAAFAQGEARPGVFSGVTGEKGEAPEIAFLFTGQGSQYVGMGKELFETQEVFRAALEECDAILRPCLERPLLAVLYPEPGEASPLDETAYTQPALFALEYALAQMWRSWGIEPSIVMGHSVGEYAAACVAGVFSLEEGLRLIAERGRLIQSLPSGGAMAAVFAGRERVAEAIAQRKGALSIAAENGPENTVISGERAAVVEALEAFEKQGVGGRELTVSHAFHSPLVEPILDDFERAAAAMRFSAPRIGLISNVTGRLFGAQEAPDASYWRSHVRQAVRFASAVETLRAEGVRILVEIGPKATLLGMARGCDAQMADLWAPSLRPGQSDWQTALDSLAQLYVHGAQINWLGLDSRPTCPPVDLPTYPFQRKRYWKDAAEMGMLLREEYARAAAKSIDSEHPLLGVRVRSALKTVLFESHLSESDPAFLADHRFYATAILPAAAYFEMARAGAAEALDCEDVTLEGVAIRAALALGEDETLVVQTILTPDGEGAVGFEIYSLLEEAEQGESRWRMHASGKARRGGESQESSDTEDLDLCRKRCSEKVAVEEFYAQFDALGVEYQARFRGIESIWRGAGEALARIRLPESIGKEEGLYGVHPVLLDSAIQLIAATMQSDGAEEPPGEAYMPVGIEACRFSAPARGALWGRATIREGAEPGAETLTGDMFLFSESGLCVAALEGLQLKRTSREALARLSPQRLRNLFYEVAWEPAPVDAGAEAPLPEGPWLIVADRGGVGEALAALLGASGAQVAVAYCGEAFGRDAENKWSLSPDEPEAWKRLLEDCGGALGAPFLNVVHLWSLDAGASIDEAVDPGLAQRLVCASALHLVQALNTAPSVRAARLWLATQGACVVGDQAEAPALAQAPLWGLGAALALEQPEMPCIRVDLDPAASLDSAARALWDAARTIDAEGQVAFRDGVRHVARLVNDMAASAEARGKEELAVPDGPFELDIAKRGLIENLRFKSAERPEPGPGQIEIRVRATGLNFRDVLNVMGMFPGDPGPLGKECAGTVTALGVGVSDFVVGDAVVALALRSLSRYVVADAALAMRLPKGLRFDEAASVPLCFVTVLYGLERMAALAAGERVLIHAAAGGVGLAAVQIAQRAGAEVFATAGSPRKRAFLASLGIEHVLDSRSLEFADAILAITDGEGIDVVLNSLSGEFIPKSLGLLRPGGRFIEIGKRDIWSERQIQEARPGVAYFHFDVGEKIAEDPRMGRSIWSELADGLAAGHFKTLPCRVYPIERVVGAFRAMQRARHIGKIVLTQREEPSQTAPDALLHSDGSYLITGGLGALGLAVAEWMVERGARHLVLTGRSAGSVEAQAAVEALREQGAEVLVARADVARFEEMQALFAQIEADMPPVRGVVHSAGVLADGLLQQQQWERFETVMAPKIGGSWNLHLLTRHMDLDFFVLFSSISSLFGAAGQSNYAAANAFLDALARYRQACGLPGLSINWGAWTEAGMVASLRETDRRRVADSGIGGLATREGLAALERLLERAREAGPLRAAPQVGVAPVDWSRLRRMNPAIAQAPFYANLYAAAQATEAGAAAPGEARQSILDAPSEERLARIGDLLAQSAGSQLGIAAGSLDRSKSLTAMGFDSLMAVDLRNRIERELAVGIPVVRLLEGPSIEELAEDILGEFGVEDASRQEAQAPDDALGAEEAQELLGNIDEMSDDEVDALLNQMSGAGQEES